MRYKISKRRERIRMTMSEEEANSTVALVISSASLRMSHDMAHTQVPILFIVLCQKVGTSHPTAVPLLPAVGVR